MLLFRGNTEFIAYLQQRVDLYFHRQTFHYNGGKFFHFSFYELVQMVFHAEVEQIEKTLHFADFVTELIDLQIEPPFFELSKVLLHYLYYCLGPLGSPVLRNLCYPGYVEILKTIKRHALTLLLRLSQKYLGKRLL